MRGNGTYGIKRPSLVNPNTDVEIWYHYRPERNSSDRNFTEFRQYETPSAILQSATATGTPVNSDNRLPGMYNLTLPVSLFGRKGYYTLYIKPKEITCKITDIGTLVATNDVRGIVLDTEQVSNDLKTMLSTPDGLVGYRVEYFEYSNGLKRQEYFRIITSNNLCEPVSDNSTSSYASAKNYRLTDNGSLCFLTVTPSTSPTFKANTLPYIGTPNQTIVLTNTKFDPVMVEINVTEHDIETISTMLEGDQIRSLDRGLVTTYNKNGEIYLQQSFYSVKDTYTQTDQYEIRKKNNAIDTTPDYKSLTNL